MLVLITVRAISRSACYVGHECSRHWAVDGLDDAVVAVNEHAPAHQGFRTEMTGSTVTVEADICGISA